MYPNLLVPLLGIVIVLVAVIGFIALRQPVSRRLAMRQLSRRRSEAVLAIIGSVLGTAIIAGALIVGDTLNFSVRQDAYRTLGPIDERIVSPSPSVGDEAATRLQALRTSPDVDGVLSAHFTQAAATTTNGGRTRAEPQVLVWGIDLAAAQRFGAAGGPSGLGGPDPGPGQVVINRPLADSLHLRSGDSISLFLFGAVRNLSVARIVPDRGLAGTGLGAELNRNVFMTPQALQSAAQGAQTLPESVTFISNRGGVERGAKLTTSVTAQIRSALGVVAEGVLIDTPKHNVLDAAKTVGDSLGSLFLMIGSFSIIAGALLLVNIFVMLAEERKSQLGMLRAMGMRRSRLIGSLALEGSTYAVASVVPGLLVGLAVGWAVAQIAAAIFRGFSANGQGLSIAFAVTPTSVINAAAMGLIIGIGTILLTAVRISRFNVIAAIRDLPPVVTSRSRRNVLVVASAFAALFAVASVPALASSDAIGTYLFPALACVCALPLLRRMMRPPVALTAVASVVLVWTLLAPLARPRMFDHASMAVFVVEGTLVAFSAVALVSQNQAVLLRPLRRVFGVSAQSGLAFRLAVAYPLAKRMRTAATLVMYTMISLVLVLLVEVAGVINASIDHNVAEATAGNAVRVDFNAAASQDILAGLRAESAVAGVTPLVTAEASATDPGHRSAEPIRALAVGVPKDSMHSMRFSKRLPGLNSDAAVWALLARDPHYVALDQFFGSTGGPGGSYYKPGGTFRLSDPVSGQAQVKTIAGILSSAFVFYPQGGAASSSYPIVEGADAVWGQFGGGAKVDAALLSVHPGVDPTALGTGLQGRFLSGSLVATPLASAVRRQFAANIEFFRLMQGFLALGLVVGIVGLGVVMVRAVRERRRTIGVLRALGFRAGTVERSFLLESGMIAAEGVLLGAVLGVVTTWLMYQKSAMFNGVRVSFPVEWATIGVLAVATLIASLAATMAPARRAAHIDPAVAVRVAD